MPCCGGAIELHLRSRFPLSPFGLSAAVFSLAFPPCGDERAAAQKAGRWNCLFHHLSLKKSPLPSICFGFRITPPEDRSVAGQTSGNIEPTQTAGLVAFSFLIAHQALLPRAPNRTINSPRSPAAPPPKMYQAVAWVYFPVKVLLI